MLTDQDRDWHRRYEQAPPVVKRAVDEACEEVQRVMREHGFGSAADDRAEALAAATTRYLVSCWVPA